MGFQDDFARALVARRGGVCDGADGSAVRAESLDCSAERPIGTGQGREACDEEDEEDKVSRLRSTRTDGVIQPLSSSNRHPELDSGSREDVADGHDRTPCAPDQARDDEKKATTRHDGWSPEIRAKFLDALANCGNIASAALFVQRSRTSAYNLKRRDMDFSLAWDAALLLARDVATDTLQDRAINGVEEEIFYHGDVIATRRRYDSRLLLAHIARLDKLAEDLSTSRAAARFADVTEAIAKEDDIAPIVAEPSEAEKLEQARILSVMGLSAEAESVRAEPTEPYECTYKDDAPEIYMMTQAEADHLAAEVEGITVRAASDADALAAITAAKEAPRESLDADDAGAEKKEHDPVHIVNFDGAPPSRQREGSGEGMGCGADLPSPNPSRRRDGDKSA